MRQRAERNLIELIRSDLPGLAAKKPDHGSAAGTNIFLQKSWFLCPAFYFSAMRSMQL